MPAQVPWVTEAKGGDLQEGSDSFGGRESSEGAIAMIQPITLLSAGLCLGVLYLRYRSQPKDGPRRSTKQKLKTAKVLGAALLAWMAVSYALQHQMEKIDGAAHEPSMMERIVAYLSK